MYWVGPASPPVLCISPLFFIQRARCFILSRSRYGTLYRFSLTLHLRHMNTLFCLSYLGAAVLENVLHYTQGDAARVFSPFIS